MVGMAEGVLRDLLDGGPGGQRGPFAELLREVLSTPEGRAAFLGSFLGTLLGGLLADMITRAIGTGMALENLLTGLGLGGGLSNLIGESGQLAAGHAPGGAVVDRERPPRWCRGVRDCWRG
ncbi:hypothetical protein H3H54_02300 [Brachybacterium sp. Z12]|uniref:hypothetical protein n=1 Tax=Brachybacterium sp. Z12 TaxID=2759167 RepID=UPI00185F6E3B|nr:hypothetical protein [Brachybacterium sp. Z12]QNN82761.1 hypothetical protein H3H54_02300 [Brachybacterium sp. Z12]